MRLSIAGLILSVASLTVAGCSNSSLKPQPDIDPNIVPANYRMQVATYLRTELGIRADFLGALIGAPTLKPVASSQRIVVCLQFPRRTEHRDKVVIYLAGSITQYVDSKPEQCADAAYQPFPELAQMAPDK